MHIFKNKKFVFLILSFIILLITLAVFYFLYLRINQPTTKSEIQEFTQNINNISTKYKGAINQDQIKETLDILNNKTLPDEDRYNALENLAFYLATAYAAVHDPEIREYVNSLDNFAKNSFPENYKEGNFFIGCADPDCGMKPNKEMQDIQNEINMAGIEDIYLNTINKNLEQAIYMPIDNEGKKYGFAIVITDLRFENNPKASAAAGRLMDYIKREYSIDFNDVKINEPDKL